MTAPQPITHIQKTNKRESILERSNNFTNNLSGYVSGSSPWLNQVHHIMVCCLFKYSRIEEALNKDSVKTNYCYDCLWITPWDINRASNLFQLPLWGAYVSQYAGLTASSIGALPFPPPNGPVNLPCHNRDHNNKTGYNREVKQWLVDNVWNALNVVQQDHKVDAKIILTQLTQGETDWRTVLTDRGTTRQGGTVKAWIDRHTNPLWYEPFSMAAVPTPRKA